MSKFNRKYELKIWHFFNENKFLKFNATGHVTKINNLFTAVNVSTQKRCANNDRMFEVHMTRWNFSTTFSFVSNWPSMELFSRKIWRLYQPKW